MNETLPVETLPESPRKPKLPDLLRGPFDVKSFALSALFVMALFYTMYLTRSLLLPMVLAMLLSYLLAPLVRLLMKIHIPSIFGAGIVMLSLIGIVGYSLSFLATPAAAWMEKAPYSLQKFQNKLRPLKQPMKNVSDATAEIEKITAPAAAPAERHQVVEVKSSRMTDVLLTRTPEFLAQTVTLLILLYFLLAYDGLFLRKLIKLTPSLADKKRAVEIAREIEASISKYLVTVTCINIGLGAAVGTAVFFLGLPNPVLWGTMAAALNFVPYLGALTGIVAMTLGAVLSFDSLGWAMVFPATYFAIATLEGNFITPFILGKSLTINPIMIFIGLMFWGWMWGIAGALLAVPILATFKIFCDHIEPLAPVGEFLSD